METYESASETTKNSFLEIKFSTIWCVEEKSMKQKSNFSDRQKATGIYTLLRANNMEWLQEDETAVTLATD